MILMEMMIILKSGLVASSLPQGNNKITLSLGLAVKTDLYCFTQSNMHIINWRIVLLCIQASAYGFIKGFYLLETTLPP